MRLCILLLVVLLCVELSSASRFGRLFGSALAVHKKGRKARAGKAGDVLNKSKKVKVVSLKKLKDDIDSDIPKTRVDVVKDSGMKDPTVVASTIKRQASLIGRQQMFLSITRMVLSRFVFKINYKDPKTLVYARLTFVAYLMLFQGLLWFLNQQINKRDDTTVLSRAPNTGMKTLLNKIGALSGQSAMTSTLLNLAQLTTSTSEKTTVKVHDLQQLKELTSTLYFELFMTSLVHFALGFQIPVLMAPLMGVCKLLQHPLVLLHVFRFQPLGQLERPFRTGLETFLNTLSPPATPTTASVNAEPFSAPRSSSIDSAGVEEDKIDSTEASHDIVVNEHNTSPPLEATDNTASESEEDTESGESSTTFDSIDENRAGTKEESVENQAEERDADAKECDLNRNEGEEVRGSVSADDAAEARDADASVSNSGDVVDEEIAGVEEDSVVERSEKEVDDEVYEGEVNEGEVEEGVMDDEDDDIIETEDDVEDGVDDDVDDDVTGEEVEDEDTQEEEAVEEGDGVEDTEEEVEEENVQGEVEDEEVEEVIDDEEEDDSELLEAIDHLGE